MKYTVTLKYKNGDHLVAMANDGIHGEALCAFPPNSEQLSRYDINNQGKTIQVSKLIWTGNQYRIPANGFISTKPNDIQQNESLVEDKVLSDYQIKNSPLVKAFKALKNRQLQVPIKESLDLKSIEDQINLYEEEQDKYYKSEYRKNLNLPEDFEITTENFNEDAFLHACNLNGWLYERAYKGIMGEYPNE